jgi:amino acid transporter
VGHGGADALVSSKPFYNPASFNLQTVGVATAFAALTYLGFDSVTTLAEDVKNPQRNVMLAAVSVCLFTGLFGGFFTYLAVLVWPDYGTFENFDNAFLDVAARVGGNSLFAAMGLLLVVANIGAGMTSQTGASRLLFGMGRDNIFPRKFFAHLSPRKTPTNNILLIGVIAFAGAQWASVEIVGHLLNFGAVLGFMGVNVTVIWCFFIRKQPGRTRNFLVDFLVPFAAFAFCLYGWLNLSHEAWIAGGTWFAIGIVYLAIRTKGFREQPAQIDFSGV